MIKEYLSKDPGFSDLLNYAHLVEEGVILNKDGAFLMSWSFRGPDLYSADKEEIDSLTHVFNRMCTYLTDGWMIHIDEVRIPSRDYPKNSHFKSEVARLIDEERRFLYESEGLHFENIQVLTFVWQCPREITKNTRHLFIEGIEEQSHQNLNHLLNSFQEGIERCIGILSLHLKLHALTSRDLLSFLNTCISGDLLPIAVPPDNAFIDVVLSRKNVVGGYIPRMGEKHIIVLSLSGYLNSDTLSGILNALSHYTLIYRLSHRFIPLSEDTASREIKRIQKNWSNKVKGFMGIVKEVVFGNSTDKLNYDALNMRVETNEALTLNNSLETRFGYLTSSIVLMHEELSVIEPVAKEIKRHLEQKGFTAIREDVNCMDAWLGSIPGHGACNARRLLVSSNTVAHLMPLHTLWTGEDWSHKNSLLPSHSPPVFYARTTGHTPFRFHLDVEDVGHQMVIGPTGSGKSTYLGLLISQFLRYQNAQIFVFDKDYSHQALTYALGGRHYNIGIDETAFCPLQNLESQSQKIRATLFVESLIELQGVALTPAMRHEIHRAIEALSILDIIPKTLTSFWAEVQSREVRDALRFYTLEGAFKLLDATLDDLEEGYLQTFEMSWLLNQKPQIYLPVLLHLFNEIEARVEEATHPTLIILEEAWLYLSHPAFSQKIRDWLKTLRKKNARVVFASQSLSDLYDPTTQSLTQTTAAILESTPTKVYLPNICLDEEVRYLYKKMGLRTRQIEIIERIGIPKKHYYLSTPQGNRLIELGLEDSMSLSFLGLSKEKSKALIECIKANPNTWLRVWLLKEGHQSLVEELLPPWEEVA